MARVSCPLADEEIEDYECMENQDCVDGILVKESLPEKYKRKKIGKKYAKSVNIMKAESQR